MRCGWRLGDTRTPSRIVGKQKRDKRTWGRQMKRACGSPEKMRGRGSLPVSALQFRAGSDITPRNARIPLPTTLDNVSTYLTIYRRRRPTDVSLRSPHMPNTATRPSSHFRHPISFQRTWGQEGGASHTQLSFKFELNFNSNSVSRSRIFVAQLLQARLHEERHRQLVSCWFDSG